MTDPTDDRVPSAHDNHVAAGGCPSISPTKAWCNGEPGHSEPHHAPYLLPPGNGRTKVKQVFWTESGFLP